MWVFIFSFAKEWLREEKRTKAGRRKGVGGEGDINSAQGGVIPIGAQI